ncbi:hypothetical protein DUNSADRAFT_6111 [Dunaliella salina]|uniref:FHA domain-containing protein n=1 Tax=Dunaliella salina TaxID=3046 RepID=A0ABQ7H707_DUNSA|nr:hypothetical protein DUNSADRAFT_6111 [Dunaliella salina]|eukprot:KAF5842641.1 hypothetical protein DUNSADRAFT_6111 [Dunaliella salina]
MFVLEKLEVSAGLHTQDSTQISDTTPIESTFHALPGELILGRPLKKGAAGKSDILCANDSSISKEHAVLQLGRAPGPGREPTAVLKDISRFGTFVRGQKLENGGSVALQNGDVFKLGHKTCFRFRLKPIHILSGKDLQADLKECASTLGAHVCTEWSPQVTHVVQEAGRELVPAAVAASLTHIPVDASLQACISLLGGVVNEAPSQGSLVVTPDACPLPSEALPPAVSTIPAAELLACIVAKDRGALNRWLASPPVTQSPHQVLVPPGQQQQQDAEDLDITEPGSEDIEDPANVQGGGAADARAGTLHAASPNTSRAKQDSSRAAARAGVGEHHRGRGGEVKGGPSMPVLLPPKRSPQAPAAGAASGASGAASFAFLPPKQRPQASAAGAASPVGAGSRHGSVGAGPETAFSEAGRRPRGSPAPAVGAALPSTAWASAAATPATTAKRKRAAEEEVEEKEEEEGEGADACAAEEVQAGAEAEAQDGVQAAPVTAHTSKRTRKATSQPSSNTPEGKEDGDAHLDRVFGEAPAAKPLNLADMLSPREPPPPTAKEHQDKPSATQRTSTRREPGGMTQAGGRTKGPQQRQQLQQKRASKAAAQAEADEAQKGGVPHSHSVLWFAGSEGGMQQVPATCVRVPLIVKSVDWEGGAHEALEGMEAGESAPFQGPNFKRFRKAGVSGCLPDHAMQPPKFSLIRVDAFQATEASNAFLKGEQARRMALKRAEELFVANPKPKKHVRGKL